MGIFNRRYALIGWLVWQLGRRIAAAKILVSLVPEVRSMGRADEAEPVLAPPY